MNAQTIALTLLTASLKTAVLLALPVVAGVAVVGVAIGALQTIAQIQDQNVAFAPKLCAVAGMVAAGGPAALALLQDLLRSAIAALPHLAQS